MGSAVCNRGALTGIVERPYWQKIPTWGGKSGVWNEREEDQSMQQSTDGDRGVIT